MQSFFINSGRFFFLTCMLFLGCGKKQEIIHPSLEKITSSVYASGTIMSSGQYQVFSKANGLVEKILVKEGDEVVGYTIVTNKGVYGEHPEVDHLFNTLDQTKYNEILLSEVNYIMIGQVCVGKSHRGQGWVPKMYEFYKSLHSKNYQYLVTDISQANKRSIKMHQKIGFETIGVIEQVGTGWDIVLWDWNA